eukprot:1319097-Amorphochlora_amoeboformis.AAC.2
MVYPHNSETHPSRSPSLAAKENPPHSKGTSVESTSTESCPVQSGEVSTTRDRMLLAPFRADVKRVEPRASMEPRPPMPMKLRLFWEDDQANI